MQNRLNQIKAISDTAEYANDYLIACTEMIYEMDPAIVALQQCSCHSDTKKQIKKLSDDFVRVH